MTNVEILGRYGFTQTPCGPWRKDREDSNYGEYYLINIGREYIYAEHHGTYPEGDGPFYQESIREYAQPDQSLEDFMLQEFGPMPPLNIEITLEEIKELLTERIGWALRDAAEYRGGPTPTADMIAHYVKGFENKFKNKQ